MGTVFSLRRRQQRGRLREGLSHVEPLPWDILQALALMDGLAGDGTPFWQAVCERLLPSPTSLTQPFCWSSSRLQQLQHDDIIQGALQQQARLRALFPTDMAEPAGPGAPSWLQWAFACVRSRACKVGPEVFALIPLLDMANHSLQPNADFRPSSQPTATATAATATATASGAQGGDAFELVALRDIPAGGEVCISYTGPGGFTNQRLMAQYGFVMQGGNPADRLALDVASGGSAAPLQLQLPWMQEAMGDERFLEALTGRNHYTYAALKSLPFAPESGDAAGGSSPAAAGALELMSVDMQPARSLLQQCEALIAACPTSLDQDLRLMGLAGPLQPSCQEPSTPSSATASAASPMSASRSAPSAAAAASSTAAAGMDPRDRAAVAYRVERKRLMAEVRDLLRLYVGA